MATNDPDQSDGRMKGAVTPVVLGLSIALTVATTAALVLAIVHFTSRPPRTDAGNGSPSPSGDAVRATPLPAGPLNPLVQHEAVQPRGESTGVVYFPLPFASPPHLKLTPWDRYLIADVDETGFTWVDRERASPTELWQFFKEQADALAKPRPAPSTNPASSEAATPPPPAPQPELAWEAKGLPGDGRRRAKVALFEQTGTFASMFGTDGVVYFRIPYTTPPNVQLSGTRSETTSVTDCTPTHFRWKNAGKAQTWGEGEVTWTARGPKAEGYEKDAR